jgi:hypothetical protein
MTTKRVRPGELLGYMDRLKHKDLWPLSKIPYRRKDLIVTPYLVVAAAPGDDGARPLPSQLALHNASVQILDSAGTPVTSPVAGTTYTLRCTVINLGATAAYGGLANFYVAQPSDFDAAARTPRALMKVLGYTGFVVLPSRSATITCPRSWTPSTDLEAISSVLAHVYDPFFDPLIRSFDARNDRHVGRQDTIPDFSGVWEGRTAFVNNPGISSLIRLVITQSGLTVNMAAYMQVSDLPGPLDPGTVIVTPRPDVIGSIGIPSPITHYLTPNPQETATGIIVGGQVQLSDTEILTGVPFTENQWTLMLSDPDTLHFEHHRQYVMPGDTRPDQYLFGDLRRT